MSLRDVYEEFRAQPKVRIRVLTAEGRPSFNVPANALDFVVESMVAQQFGVQESGDYHSWQREPLTNGDDRDG